MNYSRAQVALIALLPKDGTPVSSFVLAGSAAMSLPLVAQELSAPCAAGAVRFDPHNDTYSAVRAADPKQPRK